MLLASVIMTGCSSDKVIEGKKYTTYGVINQDDNKSPNIKYKPVWGNIILGCLLVETIIAPIYFFGFDMFEPDKKN